MQSPVNKEQVAFDLLENIQASFALYEVISENDKVIDLRLLWANQLYLDVVKLSLEEAAGMLFSQIAPHDISWIQLYGDVGLRKKDTQIIESYSDEAKQFIHVQAYSPVPGQVATVLHVRNKFVQFKMEKDLSNLQNILNGLDMMIYVTEINTGKILFVNKRMMDSFKLKKSVIGEYCYKVFREGHDAMCQFCPCFELNKDPEKLIVWEEYISNTQQYIRHNDSYINWPNGEKVHLQYAVDITEQVNAERKIVEKNEFNRIMFDNAPIGFVVFDENFQLIDCNGVVPEILGVAKEYYLNNLPKMEPEYQPDGSKSSEKRHEYMKRALDGEIIKTEWMHCSPEGEHIPTEVTLIRIKQVGKYIGFAYFYDLRNIKALEKKAEEAYYDMLTGIHNRRYLDEALNGLIKSLSRVNSSLSLMMIDIDYFKLYNDTYGHIEGDNCLKMVAEAIKKSITRETDFIARYGGEEFIVVLPHTDEDGAHIIAGKLLENIRNAKIPHSKSSIADYVTISIGVVIGKVNYFQSGSDYIKKADEMLYISKQSGRNRYNLAQF